MSEDEKINISVIWNTTKTIFKGLVLLLAILFVVNFFRNCNRVSIDKPNNDPTHDSNVVLSHEIKKSKATTDSRETRSKAGKDTIVKFEIRYKTKIIEIVRLAPDTCNPYLIAMINEAADLDSVQNAQIARLDSNNTEYKNQIGLLKQVTHNDTLRINQLTDSIPKVAKSEFKRGKKVGRKQGVIGTVIVGTALFIGVKSVMP